MLFRNNYDRRRVSLHEGLIAFITTWSFERPACRHEKQRAKAEEI